MENFETNGEITGKIDVEAIGPSAQGEANHRREWSHGKHYTCSYYTFTCRFHIGSHHSWAGIRSVKTNHASLRWQEDT